MKVWRGSFELSQERLRFVGIAGVTAVIVSLIPGQTDSPIRQAIGALGLPRVLGIEDPVLLPGLQLLMLGVLLTIVSMVWIRFKIRRENRRGRTW